MVNLLAPKLCGSWYKVVWDDGVFQLTIVRLDIFKVNEHNPAVIDDDIVILEVTVAEPCMMKSGEFVYDFRPTRMSVLGIIVAVTRPTHLRSSGYSTLKSRGSPENLRIRNEITSSSSSS